jgi:tRNA G18 (ribose-2'-O)-methylase SpoU
MTRERLLVTKQSLDRNQPDLSVVMENVRKPHNLAAVATGAHSY